MAESIWSVVCDGCGRRSREHTAVADGWEVSRHVFCPECLMETMDRE